MQEICLDDAAGVDVAVEDLAVGGQRVDTLLDAGPTGIVEADDRRADLPGEIHDFADLLGVAFAERPADDGEVLAEDEDLPSADRAVTGDHPVAGRAFPAFGRGVPSDLEDVDFFEGSFVEQQVEPLPGGQLAPLVLDLDAFIPAAGEGVLSKFMEFEDVAVHDFDHQLFSLSVRTRVRRPIIGTAGWCSGKKDIGRQGPRKQKIALPAHLG